MGVENGARLISGVVDLHNHLIPGVDDGARDLAESRAALAEFGAAGVVSLVATPHLRGSLTQRPAELERRLAELDEGWAQLSGLVAAEFEGLVVQRGVELMLDTPAPDLSDPRLRLAGGEFVLLEFPFMVVPPRSAQVISDLRLQGWRPVIAHPERYGAVDRRLEIVGEWRRHGGLLQVNMGSVVGRYGEEAQTRALEMLARGWVDLVASDYHARGRSMIGPALEWFAARGAGDTARLLVEVNPSRILAGEDPIPVPPLELQRSLWSRIRKVFR